MPGKKKQTITIDKKQSPKMDKTLATIIPVFSYPASEWAAKLKIVFEAADIKIHDGATQKKVLPLLLSKLPSDILNIVPNHKDLDDVLDFLRSYDKTSVSLDEILRSKYTVDSKPSIYFRNLQQKVKKALPLGTSDDTIALLAWQRLLAALPTHLQAAALVLDCDAVPTNEVLKRLDKLLEQNNSCSSCAIGTIMHEEAPQSSSRPMRPQDNLSAVHAATSSQPYRPAANSSYNNRYNNNYHTNKYNNQNSYRPHTQSQQNSNGGLAALTRQVSLLAKRMDEMSSSLHTRTILSHVMFNPFFSVFYQASRVMW